MVLKVHGTWALDGGSRMSHVLFKKWQCPLSLFMHYSCRFYNSLMSHVKFKKCPCHVTNIFSPCRYASCRMSILRKGHVALSKLTVKGPIKSSWYHTGDPQLHVLTVEFKRSPHFSHYNCGLFLHHTNSIHTKTKKIDHGNKCCSFIYLLRKGYFLIYCECRNVRTGHFFAFLKISLKMCTT